MSEARSMTDSVSGGRRASSSSPPLPPFLKRSLPINKPRPAFLTQADDAARESSVTITQPDLPSRLMPVASRRGLPLSARRPTQRVRRSLTPVVLPRLISRTAHPSLSIEDKSTKWSSREEVPHQLSEQTADGASRMFSSAPTFVQLHNAGFKFVALATSIDQFVRAAEAFTDVQLAYLTANDRKDHKYIHTIFLYALTLPGQQRIEFLRIEDAAQKEARKPFSLQSTSGQRPQAIWKTQTLVNAIERVSANGGGRRLSPIRALRAKLSNVRLLVAPALEPLRDASAQLFSLALTAEEAVEVARWLARVVQMEFEGSSPNYEAMYGARETVKRLLPRPPPGPYLALFREHYRHVTRPRHFAPRPQHLILLLDVYNVMHLQDVRPLEGLKQADLDPRVKQLERRHLEDVRAIHLDMRHYADSPLSVKERGSLMNAYGYGRSFKNVQALWESARGEQGMDVDRRTVSIYFDACGFNGALPEALAAYKYLQATGFNLNENNYWSYHEALNRCGAWTELVVAIRDQRDRHRSDPGMTPAIAPSQLVGSIRLADRLLKNPRHSTLHRVNFAAFSILYAQLKSLVGPDIWSETERLIGSSEQYTTASKVPMSPPISLEQDEEDEYAPWD